METDKGDALGTWLKELSDLSSNLNSGLQELRKQHERGEIAKDRCQGRQKSADLGVEPPLQGVVRHVHWTLPDMGEHTDLDDEASVFGPRQSRVSNESGALESSQPLFGAQTAIQPVFEKMSTVESEMTDTLTATCRPSQFLRKHLELNNAWTATTESECRSKVSIQRKVQQKNFHRTSLHVLMANIQQTRTNLEPEDAGVAQWCFVRPGSRRKHAWDSFGLGLIAYEIFTAPLQIFSPPFTDLSRLLTLAGTIYWTLDITMQFFMGYFTKDGIVESRLWKIRRAYMKRWFLLDIIAVVIDYMCVALSDSSTLDYVGLVRILRFIRLVRVLKVPTRVESWTFGMHANKPLIILGMLQSFGTIIIVCHFLACGWYALGLVSNGRYIWIDEYRVRGREWQYRYFTSLHWALTQFTPASMEIHATNSVERGYTVLNIMLGIIAFSSLVGGTTASIQTMRADRRQRWLRESKMRRYMEENNIAASTRFAVFSFLKFANRDDVSSLRECDLELITILPIWLKTRLRAEVFSIPFARKGAHPLMRVLVKWNMCKSYKRLCDSALAQGGCMKGREVFDSRGAASKMYFITKGGMEFHGDSSGNVEDRLSYLSYNKSTRSRSAHSHDGKYGDDHVLLGDDAPWHLHWFCEAALWLNWSHVGRMSALKHSELVELTAEPFQKEFAKDAMVGVYAHIFLKYVLHHPEQASDVMADDSSYEDLEMLACSADAGDRKGPRNTDSPFDRSDSRFSKESKESAARETSNAWTWKSGVSVRVGTTISALSSASAKSDRSTLKCDRSTLKSDRSSKNSDRSLKTEVAASTHTAQLRDGGQGEEIDNRPPPPPHRYSWLEPAAPPEPS
jgi:hypothetical protein